VKEAELDNSGYKTALKSTAIFGGAQIVTIAISVVKTKLVALWLGTFGMGLMGLFNTAVTLVSNVTNLGLQSSAVREIASRSEEGGRGVSEMVTALRRWVFSTGLFGTLLMAALSPLLSNLYFKSPEYTTWFIALSVVVLLQGVAGQENAILQGTRQIGWLVKANIFGALFSFIVSIPLFYFLRDKGIIPSLIAVALCSAAVALHYSRRVKFEKVRQSWRETLRIGGTAVKLGIALAVSSVMGAVVEFVVRGYMTRTGGVADVGLYAAGWAINSQYLGLVFTAMGKDYFPRLSACSGDNRSVEKMMNEQSEVAVLILAPMIAVMVLFIPFFVRLLYSAEFLASVSMVKWLLFGSLIRAGSWGSAYVIVAKGDAKTYLFTEITANLLALPLYLLGYHFFGLEGIGYGFVANYVLYITLIMIVVKSRYGISYHRKFLFLFSLLLVLLLGMMLSDAAGGTLGMVAGVVLALLVCTLALKGLDERVGIKSIIAKLMKK